MDDALTFTAHLQVSAAAAGELLARFARDTPGVRGRALSLTGVLDAWIADRFALPGLGEPVAAATVYHRHGQRLPPGAEFEVAADRYAGLVTGSVLFEDGGWAVEYRFGVAGWDRREGRRYFAGDPGSLTGFLELARANGADVEAMLRDVAAAA